MEKIEIARELYNNELEVTGRRNLLLEFYIGILSGKFQLVSDGDGMFTQGGCWLELEDAVRRFYWLDDQMKYLEASSYDMTGWMIREIPIADSFMYCNKATNQAFDLDTYDEDGQIRPSYMLGSFQVKRAVSIEEAIANYLTGE